MTAADLELITRAAIAAGAKPYDWDTSGDGLFLCEGGPKWLARGDPDGIFDPLDDSRDTFWLMTKLGINVEFDGAKVRTAVCLAATFARFSVDAGDDIEAATRRAIVTAAAELSP